MIEVVGMILDINFGEQGGGRCQLKVRQVDGEVVLVELASSSLSTMMGFLYDREERSPVGEGATAAGFRHEVPGEELASGQFNPGQELSPE